MPTGWEPERVRINIGLDMSKGVGGLQQCIYITELVGGDTKVGTTRGWGEIVTEVCHQFCVCMENIAYLHTVPVCGVKPYQIVREDLWRMS